MEILDNMADQKDWPKEPKGTWHPGDYLCKCRCGIYFCGRKHSTMCWPCAEKYDQEAAQAHIARLEAALVEADGARIGAEELAVLREVVRLVDEARERYDKRPRGAGGQRMPDEIDDLLCRLYEIGAHPALRAQATEGGA